MKTKSVIDIRLAMFPNFLTTKEVAAILGVTKWAIYKKVERKQIPFYSAAYGRLIFVRSEIKAWVVYSKRSRIKAWVAYSKRSRTSTSQTR